MVTFGIMVADDSFCYQSWEVYAIQRTMGMSQIRNVGWTEQRFFISLFLPFFLYQEQIISAVS